MFAGKTQNWRPICGCCGAVCFDKNRHPNGGIWGPISRDSFFSFGNVFLGQICYNFMRVSFTINIGFVSEQTLR